MCGVACWGLTVVTVLARLTGGSKVLDGAVLKAALLMLGGLAAAALVSGLLSIVEIKLYDGRRTGGRRAWAGVVAGAAWLALATIYPL